MRFFLLVLMAWFGGSVAFPGEPFRVMFYNVENFFDCSHDSLKNDYEYLPGGIRGWSPNRFWKKAGQIARVVASVGETKCPELVGLAEVENENALKSLLKGSPLRNAPYGYVHEESSDARGMDVCLLYHRYLFHIQQYEALKIHFQNEPSRTTRDVLFVSLQHFSGQILHLFVCHLPSRLGGSLETETYRRQVARVLRVKVDSLLAMDSASNILVMGDFNDFPSERSLRVDLKSRGPLESSDSTCLYNLMLPLEGHAEFGTNKHQANWGILDQILVSNALLQKNTAVSIFRAGFLLIPDERWLGIKPFRTYHGMVYQGGYSDHLPVYADFQF